MTLLYSYSLILFFIVVISLFVVVFSVPPEIQMTNSRIGQERGKETILECRITAFPLAINYWEKDGRRITSSLKYRIDAYDEGEHTITLSLRIHGISDIDYGEYKCVAANAHGKDEEASWLYGKNSYSKLIF